MNRDKLTNANPREVANAAMTVIDRLQTLQAEVQIAGTAATFVLLCEHLGITPSDVFAITTNVMNHAEGRRPEFAAVAQYLENEL